MLENSLLTPKRAIYNAIGAICKKPSLLTMDGINLVINDFEEDFYKIVFGAVNNIIIDKPTISKVTEVDVDNYLADNSKAYKIYEDNNGFSFISSAIKNANVELFENNYAWIKKYSLLRDFNTYGFDVTEIYNPQHFDMKFQQEQITKLEKMDLSNIIEHFTLKMIKIKNDWNISGNHHSYEISEGLDTLLEKLKESPDYGYPFMNKYYNAVFRGMRFGKLMIKSAGTGVGKTRTALTDIASVACDELFDLDTMTWKNNGDCYSACFISTELALDEIQTCLLAIISGVSEDVIKHSQYSPEVLKRIQRAIEVLKRAPISLHYIDDFSIADIEQIVEKDILEKDVKFVWFDYIQITPKLTRTIQQEYGMGLREDQVLQNFSARLKNIATKYNIFICTATQLNRNSGDRTQRDATSIRGGSAVIDKCDHALQLYKVTQQDLSAIETIINRTRLTPNFMHIVYKNRSGRNNLIIWTIMNHGNMREKLAFITDGDYNLITDINPLDIEFKED